jgi:rubredoxin
MAGLLERLLQRSGVQNEVPADGRCPTCAAPKGKRLRAFGATARPVCGVCGHEFAQGDEDGDE